MTEKNDSIKQVVCQSLEELAFLLVDPVSPDELPDPVPPCFRARIEAKGPSNLDMSLLLCHQTALEAASNMTGTADIGSDVSPEYAAEAAKELLNTICGNLLPVIAGKDALFERKVPVCQEISADNLRQVAKHEDSVLFEAEGEPLVFIVQSI